ncbi:hypothetical protein LQZ18_03845 [Lachnospiraceae bacterium ZAX-1]
MADLMTGTYEYAALAKKYGNFCVPVSKVKISGVDILSTLSLSLAELKVVLALQGSSIVVLKIADAYDMKSHSFMDKLKSKLVLGTIVEIELGYLSSTLSVFKGYVATVGADFSELPLFVATLMDARRLMMTGGIRKVLHDVQNYSDACSTILKDYSKLCSATIEATSDNLEKPLSQAVNDYDFIMKELIQNAKVDREFFVLGEKAYFRTPRSATSPIMTMNYGRELLSLSIQEEYADLSIDVVGYNAKEQQVFHGTQDVASASSQKKVMSQTPILMIADPEADTQEKVKNRALAVAKKQEWKSKTGEGTTIGLPEVVPGRFVKVKSLEEIADNSYYITEVVHELNDESFMTRFTIGGWD